MLGHVLSDLAMLMTAGRENVWIGAQNMDQQSITDFVSLGGAMGEIYIFL